jgi:hypothetical protein
VVQVSGLGELSRGFATVFLLEHFVNTVGTRSADKPFMLLELENNVSRGRMAMGAPVPSQTVRRRFGDIILLAALVALSLSGRMEAQSKACSLVTPAELQAALGAQVSDLKGSSRPGMNLDICQGETPAAKIMLRVAKRSGDGGGMEVKGIEMMKKMGVQVEVKTFGPITCSTMTPPKNMEQYGFNTTCSVLKAGQVAAIEVTAKQQKDMVSIDKLHPLAEKIAGRF